MNLVTELILKNNSQLKNYSDHSSLERLICPICNEIMKNASQLTCGCRFCFSCIHDLISWKSETFTCQFCNEVLTSKKIISDKAIDREISLLDIKCVYGCDETIQVKDIDSHLEFCDNYEVKCKICGDKVVRKNISEHDDNCSGKLISCLDCNTTLTRGQMSIHKSWEFNNIELICSKWMGKCPLNCCDLNFENIKSHLSNDCPEIKIPCEFRNIGCLDKVARKNQLMHLENNLHNHLRLMLSVITSTNYRNFNEESNELLNGEINKTRSDMKESMKTIFETQKLILQSEEDIEYLSIQKKSLKSLLLKHNSLKFIDNQTVLWTLTDIRGKIEASRTLNEYKRIVSVPFIVLGYKFRLIIHPNGNGEYLSFYLSLMKGDNDNSLQWPFNRRINIELLTNPNNSYTFDNNQSTKFIFKPNPTNFESYKRPISDANVGFGELKFIGLDSLMATDTLLINDSLRINIKFQ